MEFLQQSVPLPKLDRPLMLFAFSGWADAAESATHALRYLVRHLRAKRFADIDPEEFYNFARVRPQTRLDAEGNRYIQWPRNRFYYHQGADGGRDVVVFIGIEPNLKWRTFAAGMVEVITQIGVAEVVHVGALLDAVPHTREARLTGTATSPELQAMVRGVQLRRSKYTGPTGITGVLMDALRKSGVPSMSLWGHAPHYLQVSPNPKVSLQLLTGIQGLIDASLDVGPLQSQGLNFEKRVKQAIEAEPEVIAYVQRLESQWDTAHGAGGADDDAFPAPSDMPEPDQAVLGIEEFLRQQRKPDAAEDQS